MKKSPSLLSQSLIKVFIVILIFSWEIKHTTASQLGDVCGSTTRTVPIEIPTTGKYVRVCSSEIPTSAEILKALEKNLGAKQACNTNCDVTDPCDGENCTCKVDENTKTFDFQNANVTNQCTNIPDSNRECEGQKLFLCAYGAAGVNRVASWDVSCNCTCQTNSIMPIVPDPKNKQTEICTSCTCGKPPSLVELSNFVAKPTNKGISLNWTTKAEPDSQGFKMWRAIPKLDSYCGCSGNIDDYTQIQVLDEEGKPVLIPAKGSTTSGSDYSYLDKDAKPGIAYCYALEDVDSEGKSEFYFEYVAFTQDNLEETK